MHCSQAPVFQGVTKVSLSPIPSLKLDGNKEKTQIVCCILAGSSLTPHFSLSQMSALSTRHCMRPWNEPNKQTACGQFPSTMQKVLFRRQRNKFFFKLIMTGQIAVMLQLHNQCEHSVNTLQCLLQWIDAYWAKHQTVAMETRQIIVFSKQSDQHIGTMADLCLVKSLP